MRRIKTLSLLFAPTVALLAFAPSALAVTHAGEGLYGPTDDKVITSWMLGLMVFFIGIIIVFSLIQGWLDHRKHQRLDAAKARATAPEWKGGW
jgi:hypothetical protein